MKKFFLTLLFVICISSPLYAVQSTIVDVEGNACMGDDKSRKQTEQVAMADAKRSAAERAMTHLKSETQVKDFAVEKDLVNAYTQATVKVIQELEKTWFKDANSGDCYRIRIEAEVVPDEKAIKEAVTSKVPSDNPGLPLNVSLWTDKKTYQSGEKIKIYIKWNKPFYARVIYRDAKRESLQLLPNPFRTENYFNGGVIYEIPSGNDRFELEVKPPFGDEHIILYSSTSSLGDISLESEGGVYQVMTKGKDIGIKTRGVKLKEKSGSNKTQASEFFEDTTKIKTGQ